MQGPRTDYLEWDEYCMFTAKLAAKRSKDPSTQVGACIYNTRNRPKGTGYNGFPRKCDSNKFPWDREAKSKLDTKYMYTSHAEANAIDNSEGDLEGCRIYVTLFPCNTCAIRIIQKGIVEVIYLEDKYHDKDEFIAARRLFDAVGIVCRQFAPSRSVTL